MSEETVFKITTENCEFVVRDSDIYTDDDLATVVSVYPKPLIDNNIWLWTTGLLRNSVAQYAKQLMLSVENLPYTNFYFRVRLNKVSYTAEECLAELERVLTKHDHYDYIDALSVQYTELKHQNNRKDTNYNNDDKQHPMTKTQWIYPEEE